MNMVIILLYMGIFNLTFVQIHGGITKLTDNQQNDFLILPTS